MSIATEISRLTQAKADIKTAIEAKGVTVPSATTIDGYAALVGQITTENWILEYRSKIKTGGYISSISDSEMDEIIKKPYCWSLFQFIKFDTCSFDFDGVDSATSHYQFQSFMELASKRSGSTGCVDVTFSTLSRILAYENFAYRFATTSTAIKSFSFPELTEITGSQAFRSAIESSYCETAEFPLLATVSGRYAFYNFAYYDSKLTSVDFGSLESITPSLNIFQNAFTGCTNLVTMRIHPGALKSSTIQDNPMATATAVVNLTITATATDNVYLDKATNLSSASVLGVLNKLDENVTGKTCAFANLTIASGDTNYSAISAKVATLTNWTITGLTL